MDRRRHRTRLRLQAALRDMLAEMPLSAVSVDALTRRAGVTRPTFYANYATLVDMLDDYLGELLDEVETRHEHTFRDMTTADREARLRGLAVSVFEDLDRSDPRLATILAGVPSLAAEARFAGLVERLMARFGPAGARPVPDGARAIHAHFHTGAFIGLLRLWLGRAETGMTPAIMGRAFTDLALHGRLGAEPDSWGDT